MLDRLHQDRDRFGGRRISAGGLRRVTALPLRSVNGGVHAVVDKPPLGLLPSEPWVGGKSREERTGVQPHQRAQLSGVKSRRRALDQSQHRLLQVAVLREEHPTPTPQPMTIELRHVRQGVEPAVVVVAVGCLPLPQPPAGRVDAAADRLRHLLQRHDLPPSKGFPCPLRSLLGTLAHRCPPVTAQVYDMMQTTDIYLSN